MSWEDQIREKSERLRIAHEAVHFTFARRHESAAAKEAWIMAAQAHRDLYRLEVWPNGLQEKILGLKERELDAIEFAVRFLEEDPWFFRSGYLKEEIIQHLGQCPRTALQDERLRMVVLQRCEGPTRREFRRYCRLARRLKALHFEEALNKLTQASSPRTVRHVRWVLEAIPK